MNMVTISLAAGMERRASPPQRLGNSSTIPQANSFARSVIVPRMRPVRLALHSGHDKHKHIDKGDKWIIETCAMEYRQIDVRERTCLPCGGVAELTLSFCRTYRAYRCKGISALGINHSFAISERKRKNQI